jgi:1-acyl-sn-glycerol-3-phosphate acyltransferase
MPHLSLAVVIASAFARLWVYEIADRLRPASPARALATLARWCRWALPWLRLHVEVEGAALDTACVYVANHRSYLDGPVLAGVLRAAFLSRADVASWPVIGPVARLTEVVFVDREDAHDRQRAVRQLLERLRTGSIVVFPEGTTTGAPLPAPFRSGLFRHVHPLSVPIVPVTLRYSSRRVYWVDDLNAWQHFKAHVLAAPPLRVTVHIGSRLRTADYPDAEQLAAAVYAAVAEPLAVYGELTTCTDLEGYSDPTRSEP